MSEPTWAVNLPLPGLSLPAARTTIEALPDLGFDQVWTGEGGGFDAFTPLTAAAAWQPRLSVGTGVVPVGTRGHGVLAQTAATLAELTAGEVLLGIGSSVPAHVTQLNGVPFGKPLGRVRDTARFLRRAFAGETIHEDFETFNADGYGLGFRPARPPKVIVGALREKMMRLAYDEADGAIVNMLGADDLPQVLGRADAPRAGKRTIVKLFLCPTADRDWARRSGRGFLGWILNQKPYFAFHSELRRGPRMVASQERFLAGDAAGAAAAIPEDVVDELWISGSPEQCREQIARFVLPGVTTVLLYVAPTPELLRRPEGLPQLLTALRPELVRHG
ncbi:LLM class flavin-dependent oxidoreductase [Patulibacter defluvii]|uniref:LLM class flavin-dependent oxidoreductase n=1 Tax=Patulibacter defluvii TaxID=3095358 RepID=UPI002A74795F|nr:LLM class flavin-dependent oxidoreductase [Patulibacter sp. DM4]